MGDIVTFRSALVEGFYFFAYRSFIAAVLARVVIILAAFTLVFAGNARAQQPPASNPAAQDGLFVRFLGNFFNGSQDIPDSPWPYNSGPPSDLRKFPAPQNSPPFPYAEYQIGGTPTISDRNEQTAYPLMKALFDGPDGQWKNSRIFISS
jgi:hypothetical protein